MHGKRGPLTDAFLKLKNAPGILDLFLRAFHFENRHLSPVRIVNPVGCASFGDSLWCRAAKRRFPSGMTNNSERDSTPTVAVL
jgi:hypothetical protein